MMPQAPAARLSADHDGSWMLPIARHETLLYVANRINVSVFSYPQGNPVGVLVRPDFWAHGMCVDSSGDVFVTSANQSVPRVFEYAHGSTKVKAIFKPVIDYPGAAVSCAVDPTTGNLAVTTIGEGIDVFERAMRAPVRYSSLALKNDYYCAYDGKGNLFFDGNNAGFYLAELPKNNRDNRVTELHVAFPGTIFPGGVWWDGKYLDVLNSFWGTVYRYRIRAHRAFPAGAFNLTGGLGVLEYWVEGNTLIAPSGAVFGRGKIRFYHYPDGGSPFRTVVSSNLEFANGVVVSKPAGSGSR